jgi:hypothetical protein
VDLSPVAAPPIAQPGPPVKQSRRCAAVLRTLDWQSRLCYSQGATGDISSRAAPLSQDWERGGGKRVERFSPNNSVVPIPNNSIYI